MEKQAATESLPVRHPIARRSGDWRGAAIGLGMLVLLGAGGYLIARTRVFWSRPDAAVVVDSRHLDCGEAWAQHEFLWSLPIRNTTGREIRLEFPKNEWPPGCSSIEPASLTLPARGEAAAVLTLDLVRIADVVISEPRRRFSLTIVAEPEIPAGDKVRWDLTGVVRTPFRFSAPAMDFQESLAHGFPFSARSVRIVCNEPVENIAVDGDPSIAAVTRVKSPNPNTREYVVSVRPHAHLPLGDHAFFLNVRAQLADRTLTPSIRLPVRAPVLENIRILPNLCQLGALKLGTEAEETLRLESRSEAPFSIVGVEPDSESVTLAATRVISPTACDCTFRCRADMPGNTGVRVTFQIRYDDDREESVKKELWWYGVEVAED